MESSAALSQQGRIFKFRRTKTKAGDIAVRSSDGGSAGSVCADAWNAREKASEGRVIAFAGRRLFEYLRPRDAGICRGLCQPENRNRSDRSRGIQSGGSLHPDRHDGGGAGYEWTVTNNFCNL